MRGSCQQLFRFASVVFCLFLAACGSGGGGGGDSGGGGNSQPPSKLFVADSTYSAIGSLTNSNPSPGTTTVDRIIMGANTNLSSAIRGLALDAANDRLYVGNALNILVFNNVSTANGDIAPSRVLTASTAGGLYSIYLDTVNDVLYAADAIDRIKIYNNASTAQNVGPDRTISSTSFGSNFWLSSVAVDVPRDILYVSVAGQIWIGSVGYAYAVLVFDHASTLNGTVAPDRVIANWHGDLFIDSANDRLYMADGFSVLVLENASTRTGAVSPDRNILLPYPTKITVDLLNDRLYALTSSALYIVSNISTANGAVPATQITVPGAGVLSAVAVKP
jgi:hypothetical protein